MDGLLVLSPGPPPSPSSLPTTDWHSAALSRPLARPSLLLAAAPPSLPSPRQPRKGRVWWHSRPSPSRYETNRPCPPSLSSLQSALTEWCSFLASFPSLLDHSRTMCSTLPRPSTAGPVLLLPPSSLPSTRILWTSSSSIHSSSRLLLLPRESMSFTEERYLKKLK